MQREHGMPLAYAQDMANALVELLAPACERIEIAGSVRRLKPEPNDIEIVAVPRIETVTQSTLLGPVEGKEFNHLDECCDQLLYSGDMEKRPDKHGKSCWGTGIKRAIFYQGQDYAPVDLFQVVEPGQWGVIYAIRTGPGDFNRMLVTSRPLDRKVAGGRVWFIDPNREDYARMPASKFARLAERGGIDATLIPTLEEEDFFRQLRVPHWSPRERTVERLCEHLRQK